MSTMAMDRHLSERSSASTTPRRMSISTLGNYVSERVFRKTDLATGAVNTWEQIATLRPLKERKAMGRFDRHRLESQHNGHWSFNWCMRSGGGQHNQRGEEMEDDKPQYTIESRRRVKKSIFPFLSFRQKFCYCCSRTTMTADEYHSGEMIKRLCFIDVNALISSYLSWSFRTSYVLLFGVFASLYFSFILIFALIYYGISLHYPMCVNSNGDMIGVDEETSIFGDCFHLSWTTFSTVGYGLIFPATGASDFFVPNGCVGVGILGSFQAFMGVVYADFCATILFGKVLRTQNNAQVFFSDPIVVRFGKKELYDSSSDGSNDHNKVQEAKGEYDEELGGLCSNQIEKDIPCPSLEFRLVNCLHGVPSGEIVNAKLDCVAILDPKLSKWNKTLQINDNDTQSVVDEKTTISELAKVLRDTNSKTPNRTIAFHSADSKQPHMFTKLALDANEHPYFRRVWFGRHRLDENSPLLTPVARNRVKLNDGSWPAEMNNYESIKNSIHFRHILVCIQGTSKASATSVYAQKVYDLVDVTVGYRFVPMNYRTDDGDLKTDSHLLNAVYQQRGGGAEPFQ
mmetsp:Transcript_23512/g.42470  ORF Transcript_23512/g.42470 Transcript_23512/m.42470 type:complete len:570 (+) Transcript_23512:20-1729(+)